MYQTLRLWRTSDTISPAPFNKTRSCNFSAPDYPGIFTICLDNN